MNYTHSSTFLNTTKQTGSKKRHPAEQYSFENVIRVVNGPARSGPNPAQTLK